MPEDTPLQEPYRLDLPERLTSGVVFASPHSGRSYPEDLIRRSHLGLPRLRSSEDAFVDRLLAAVPGQGATLLTAIYPRAYVDLNRGEDELDPALIEGLPRAGGSSRVAVGLGVIPRVVAGGREIYSGKISRDEAETRLARVWRPYHARLQAVLQARCARFGRAILFDVHSMPSEAAPGRLNGPEIVLGDRFGASASAPTMQAIETIFRQAGFRVARNAPFAGAYIAQRYGRPAERIEVVQIEIARSLYMIEERIEPRADFARFAAGFARVTAQLADLVTDADQLAAE